MEGGKMDRLVRTDGESDGRRWDKVISDKCVCGRMYCERRGKANVENMRRHEVSS